MVVVSNQAAFQERYPNVSAGTIAGQFTGHLSLGGEDVQLTSPDGTVSEDFKYSSSWYPQTDGGGFSLQVVDPNASNAVLSTAAGWEPSGTPGGTPGAAEANPIPLPGSVVINEVLANPTTPGGDMIELANTTAQAINVGGWWLSDSSSNLEMYQIATGTILAANGYLVLSDSKNYGASSGDPGVKTPFARSPYGFSLTLASNVAGVAGGYRDVEIFGATPPGVAVGRYTTSAGDTDFVMLSTPMFGAPPNYTGAANSSAAYVPPVDVSQLMYAPPAPTTAESADGYTSSDFQYVELTNRSSTPQSLQGLYLSGALGFTFGWYPDGTAGEAETLESGATATWQTSGLTPGFYSVYADYSLTDPNGSTRSADEQAQYDITYPGGTLNVASVDQNSAVGGKLLLGTITVSGSGSTQVVLTRGDTSGEDWTIANQIEFVKTGQDLVVGSPTFSSFATSSGLTTLTPGASVVIVSDYAAFNERYGAVANGIPVAGVFSGQLGGSSGTVDLYQAGQANGTTGYIPDYEIDPVNYSNAAPWPSQAGGSGSALIRVHPADFGSEPLSWQASNLGGTPGGVNESLVSLTPTTPTKLTAQATLNPNQIALDWSAATAPQSYVAQYAIYRNGSAIGTSTTTSYVDTTAVPGTNYYYTVSAVNRDGYASPQSTPVAIDLPGVSAYDWPTSQQMSIEFNEPLNPATAGVLGNYVLSGGVTINSVALSRDNTEVTLSTNQAFAGGNAYTLTMTGLTTASGNPLPASLPLAFTYGTTIGEMTDTNTPPVPGDLSATLTGSTQVNLSWQPAIDLTSGIAYYAIYRDGAPYNTSTTNSFTDTSGISSQTPHYYQVAAVNWDGLQGPLSAALRVVPPGIAAVTVLGPTSVEVQFTEPVTTLRPRRSRTTRFQAPRSVRPCCSPMAHRLC